MRNDDCVNEGLASTEIVQISHRLQRCHIIRHVSDTKPTNDGLSLLEHMANMADSNPSLALDTNVPFGRQAPHRMENY